MNSMLKDIFGASATNIIFVLAALAIVILAIIGVMEVIRAMGGKSFGRRKAKQVRLSVVDSAPIDRIRRLILIKRDGVEHLILVGGPSDVVIEKSIGAAHAEKMAQKVQSENVDINDDIIKTNEISKDHNHKDADLTAEFDSLLDDSELKYDDVAVSDHMDLAHEIAEDVEPEIEYKSLKTEKKIIKPDIIKNLLGRHRAKIKKKMEKTADVNAKETKQVSKVTEKAELVKADVKREKEPKIAQNSKAAPALAENSVHDGHHKVITEQDAKINKNSSQKTQEAKAQNIGQVSAQLYEEPATVQQAARERIVHEIEGVVENDLKMDEPAKELNRAEHVKRLEPNIVADSRVEARQAIIENTAPIMQASIEHPQVQLHNMQQTQASYDSEQAEEEMAEHALSRQAEEVRAVKAEPQTVAEDSITRLYREAEPKKSTIYHAPAEKMPTLEPLDKPKEQMQHTTSPHAAPHAAMTAAVTNQATALKIEDEEDCQEVIEIMAETMPEDISENFLAKSMEQNNTHAARRVPAHKVVAKPEDVKSELMQQAKPIQEMEILANDYDDAGMENVAEKVAEKKPERLIKIKKSIESKPNSEEMSEVLSVSAPVYDMENFTQAIVQPKQSFELRNDNILTQDFFYYSSVDETDTDEDLEEYREPVPQPRITAKQHAESIASQAENIRKEININAEIAKSLEQRYQAELAGQEPIGESQDIRNETDTGLDDDFDSLFEDELREVVKSDKS